MELTYTISRKDYWEFSKFYLERYRHFYRSIGINSLVIATITGIVMRSILHLPEVYVLVWCCVVAAISPPMLYWQCKGRVMRLPAKGGTMLGDHNLRIDSEGVFGKSCAGEGSIRWNGILDIVETKKYIFMFMDTAMGFIIPKSAFPSPADANQFLNAATSFWKATKTQSL